MTPDVKDLVVFSGVGATGYGLWQVYPPATWVFVGIVLLGFGILLHRK